MLPAFGSSVVNLFLHQPDDTWPWGASFYNCRLRASTETYLTENVCEAISNYHCLRSITLTLAVGLGSEGSANLKYTTLTKEETAFVECRDRLLTLLVHVQSPYIRSVSVRFAPHIRQRGPDTHRWGFTYRSSRAEAVALMFGADMRALLAEGPLSGLDVLRVHFQETDLRRDAVWWAGILRKSLGPKPREIIVDINYCKSSNHLSRSINDTDTCQSLQVEPEIRRGKFDYDSLWLEDRAAGQSTPKNGRLGSVSTS